MNDYYIADTMYAEVEDFLEHYVRVPENHIVTDLNVNDYYVADTMYAEVEDFLEHHGILGQRWGIRRTPEQLGHVRDKKLYKYKNKYQKLSNKITKAEATGKQLTKKQYNRLAGKEAKLRGKIAITPGKYGRKIEKATQYQENQKYKANRKQQVAEAKEQEKAARIAKKKAKMIDSGDWEGIYANRRLFTDSELNTISNRLNQEKNLLNAINAVNALKNESAANASKKVSQSQNANPKSAASTVIEKVGKVLPYVDTAFTVYSKYNQAKSIVEKHQQKKYNDIIKSGNLDDVYKAAPRMTNTQLKDAVARTKYMETLLDKKTEYDIANAPTKTYEPKKKGA